MLIREYTPADLAEIESLHERTGFDYRMPNLDDALFCVKQVIEDKLEVRMAMATKLQLEAYVWIDPEWGSPSERWMAFQLLHEAVRDEAEKLGLEECVANIPPELEKRFAKRLKMLGWSRDREWPTWSRSTAK